MRLWWGFHHLFTYRKQFEYLIRGKIRAAKKVHVFLDPNYRATDSRDPTAVIPVTVAQALRIVDMAPKDNPPTGVIDKHGILLLHPPARR